MTFNQDTVWLLTVVVLMVLVSAFVNPFVGILVFFGAAVGLWISDR